MKNTNLTKYGGIALTTLFGIVVFLFWRFIYPHALVYQEQYQLFLFDSSYIFGRIGLPGGTATLIAECLTQFYNHPTIGAIIQSLLLVGVQFMTWMLMKQNVHSQNRVFSSCSSRRICRSFLNSFSATHWRTPRRFPILKFVITPAPRPYPPYA